MKALLEVMRKMEESCDPPIIHWVHPTELAFYKERGWDTDRMRVIVPVPLDNPRKSVHKQNQKRSAWT